MHLDKCSRRNKHTAFLHKNNGRISVKVSEKTKHKDFFSSPEPKAHG